MGSIHIEGKVDNLGNVVFSKCHRCRKLARRPEDSEAGLIDSRAGPNDSGAGPIDCRDRSDSGIDRTE